MAIFSGKNFLNAYDIKISGENLSISVTISYNDSGIDEDTVIPYRFDGANWVAITPFTIDKTVNTITFTISSGQTIYGLFGSTAEVAPAPSGGGGGGGGGGTPTPTVSQLNDNKIDVLDFNSLMVHWGETGTSNIADFNEDNKVDVFDFNYLMIYWTV